MKKFIIPIVLAAVLGVGSGIAAVTLNRTTIASAEVPEVSNDLLKPGKYYLNGDVSTDKWVEVTPDYISLKGSDIDEWMSKQIRSSFENDGTSLTDEQLKLQLESEKLLLCDEKIYQLQYLGWDNIPYMIRVDRDNKITDREKLLKTNAGFPFDDRTATIDLAFLGKFTLVE